MQAVVDLLIQNNFKKENRFYYGVYNEHNISVSFKATYIIINISFSYPINADLAKKISRDLSSIKAEYRSMLVGAVSGGFVELTLYQENGIENIFFDIIDKTINVLNLNNVNHESICAFCGQKIEEDSLFIKVKKTVLKVHKKCIEEAEKHAGELKDKLESKTKKAHGVVTILSLIVSIGIISLMFIVGYSSMISYIAPLTGVICYICLKAIFVRLKLPINKANVIIQLAFSCLCLIGSIYLGFSSFFLFHIENLNFIEAFSKFFKIINDNDLSRDLLVSIVIGLLMVGINSIADFKYLENLDASVKKLS